ncbi:DUF1648 domain-containing protein [Streptomyces sp. MUM 203J]|uniref:DUF1648 domain-containing protein n=1 Tax=Streptomyces sp. MUM 203J TaxID=2791990 RepID=UPI001F04188A|nr:DUF1648 domain-containing protein [Streptomyces sp. MUM 203J]MCH0541061.1 DUF1648 domain-containing protein [Streptomyces sp. MUM 203J]
MKNGAERASGAMWGVIGWVVGVLVLLAGIPLAASGRLPDRLATHWSGDGAGGPDDSMPLWAAAVFPALIWAALATGVALWVRRAGRAAGGSGDPGGAVRGGAAATLLSGGTFLVGTQAAIVRANLDRDDWREAGSVADWVVAALVAAVTAGAIGWLACRRRPAPQGRDGAGPRMDLPEGQRIAWFSRAANPWLHAVSAVTGLVALAVALVALGGMAQPHMPPFAPLAMIAPFALASILVLAFASVQARVDEEGLKVSFGPFGWPARHWSVEDIESARTEHRTPAQVGGWGYRLSGLGTTVMLRGGECLVVRAGGKDFAVSVDDAERGAALLNSLGARNSA